MSFAWRQSGPTRRHAFYTNQHVAAHRVDRHGDRVHIVALMSTAARSRLVTLGRLALVDAAGRDDESLRKRKRKLAVLVVLALERRPVSRDTLVDMFWGEQEEERARHSLSDALSHLRRVLG